MNMTEHFFHIDALNAMAPLMRLWRMSNTLNPNGLQGYLPPLNCLYSVCSEYTKRRIKILTQGFGTPLSVLQCSFNPCSKEEGRA